MSSSAAHSSSGSSSRAHSGSSHSDTSLQLESNIKEYEDTAANPKDILSQPEDALPRHETTLRHLSGTLSKPNDSTMPGNNRSGGRDVNILNASDRNTILGGLILTNGVTNANLYAIVEIFVLCISLYSLRNESDVVVERDDSPLQAGNYYIDSPHPFDVNDEAVLVRTMSSSHTGPRVHAFRDAVRLRDGRCIITESVALGAQYDNWRGFEAAHIFPLAYEEFWRNNNFARWISISSIAGGLINSVQNGMLLRSDIHQLFDSYEFSINPDDGHKIVHFGFDCSSIAGKRLDQRFLDDPHRPPDELFRWHFRQAVLVNIRGAGEPIFEHDFPPGSDMMGEILEGPKAPERMEFELFSRLAAEVDLT